MAHTPLDPRGAFMREKAHFAAIERHFLQAPSMQDVFVPYLTMEGMQALSLVVVENQCGKFKRAAAGVPAYEAIDYQRLAQQVCWVIRELGDRHKLDPPPDVRVRDVEFALRKWLVPRDTEGPKTASETAAQAAQRRGKHKASSEDAANAVFERFKNCEGLRNLFHDAYLRQCNRHDMADAFLMGAAYLLGLYAVHAQAVLGRRSPGEYRPEWPVLTEEQMHGGTFRGLFIDSGSSNMGVCFMELVGMVAPPEGRPGVMAGLDSAPDCRDPEPRFRVFVLEHLNLNNPWSATRGQAVVSYWRRVAEAPVIEPDYLSDTRPLTDYFAPTGQGKKRKMEDAGEGEGKKKRKRLVKKPRLLEPTVVVEIQD